MEDYYKILGLSHDASPAEIRRSFQALALKNHPDKISSSHGSLPEPSHSSTLPARNELEKFSSAVDVIELKSKTSEYVHTELNNKQPVNNLSESNSILNGQLFVNVHSIQNATQNSKHLVNDDSELNASINDQHSINNVSELNSSVTGQHFIDDISELSVMNYQHTSNHLSEIKSVLNTQLSVNEHAEQNLPHSQRDLIPFHLITKAWKILSDPEFKAVYDACWTQRCLTQEWPIHDRVSFEELTSCEGGTLFSYPCRCGSEFVMDERDLMFKVDYVCCLTCSLCIQIIY